MDGSSFCSPPKVKRSVCITKSSEVVESSAVKMPVFHNDCIPSSHSASEQRSRHANDSTSTVSQTSVSLEGVFVDQAVENLLTLPEVVGQIRDVQKDHHQEIQRQLLQLHDLENDIQQSTEKCDSVKQEMSSVDRRTRMIEEEVQERRNLCQTYQKEIEALVTNCESLRHQLSTKRNEFNAETSKRASYISKMETYIAKVKEFESTLPAQKKLSNLQEQIKALKTQKQYLSENLEEFTAVCGGDREKELRKNIDSVKVQINTFNKEATHKQKQLSDLKAQECKIELAISVLHKRNAAQLTRLKRQVREQQLRQRQWQDQHTQLQHSIANIKTKLED